MLFRKPAAMTRSPAKLLLIAAVVFPAVAAAQVRKTAAPGERVLRFPPDRSLGRLLVYRGPVADPYDPPATCENALRPWKFLAEARGDVAVPANKLVRLDVGMKNLKDVTHLKRLKPDDLDSLVITGTQFPPHPTQAVMPYVSGLTGLKELSIFGVKVSGGELGHLRNLDALRHLTVYEPHESLDAGLPHLSKLKSLEYLSLDCRCTDAGLQRLAGATRLEKLVLGINAIQGPGLVHLEKLPALRSLTLIGQEFSNQELAHIKSLTSLTHLHLFNSRGDWEVTDAGLVHLSGLAALEELKLTHVTGITDAGMVHLKSLRSLKKLDLGGAGITDAGLAQLAEVKSLESLRDPGYVTDTGLASLAKSLKLKELSVGGEKITDEGIRHLAGVRSLEDLGLYQTAVTDAGMDSIAQLTNLQDLSLYCSRPRQTRPEGASFRPEAGKSVSPLTDAGLAKLVPLRSLRSLTLRNAKITISGLSHLNGFSNLIWLRIGDVDQDDTGMNISGLTKLEDFTIEPAKGSGIRDEDLACLARLTSLENLQFVWPDRNTVGDQGLAYLAGLTNLDRLVIGSKVTDRGLIHLRNMKKLDLLCVFGDFTDEGLRHLEELRSLEHLTIRSDRPLSRAAQNRLRKNLRNLHSLQVTDNEKGGNKSKREKENAR
jgi:Leucine-rich repeat (LRR) protein